MTRYVHVPDGHASVGGFADSAGGQEWVEAHGLLDDDVEMGELGQGVDVG